tara:strand:- start:1342 stop:3621 length:2280 start_codon:yes stop_codon:yes gene_type:complete
MKNELIDLYQRQFKIQDNNNKNQKDNLSINIHFMNGCFIELSADNNDEYYCQMVDQRNGAIIYSVNLKSGHWAKASLEYFVDWKILISKDGELLRTYKFNAENKVVLLSFESKSLGDTVAWFPYVEEFRKKHKCNLVVSTFWNDMFKDNYPNIKFINPGESVSNPYAKYDLGWFWDGDNINKRKNPRDIRLISLQESATDILGLNHKEIKPKLVIPNEERRIKEKYVCIATQSTSQAKYWNHKDGWVKVVDYLKSRGYKVVDIDKYAIFGNGDCMNHIPKNAINKTGELPIQDRMVDLKYADFFIGIGSGLSWLAWGVGTPNIMISSFSKPFCEMRSNCIRVYNDHPNSGIFNRIDNGGKSKFDASDWNWNPIVDCKSFDDWHEFETITPEQVMNSIDRMITGIETGKYVNRWKENEIQSQPLSSPSFMPEVKLRAKQVLYLNSRSIGDTISGSPIVNKLHDIYKEKIDVYTHHKEIFKNNSKVNCVYDIEESSLETINHNYDENNIHKTFMNVGNKINGIELRHNVCDIRQHHAIDLGFMLTPEEMSCEFYADDYEEIKNLPKKYVAIHPTKTWKSRSWSQHNWQQLIYSLNQKNISVVAIGKTSSELGFWGKTKKPLLDIVIKDGLNLMDKTTLSQTWHIIKNADMVITMDSGILHLAGTTDTHIVQIGSSINPKFRAPYRYGNQDYKYNYVRGGCDWCASDMKWGVREWGTIQSVPPVIDCLPQRYSDDYPGDKRNFNKCHPQFQEVWGVCKDILK